MQKKSKMQQVYDGAAFYAIDQLLKLGTLNPGNEIRVNCINCGTGMKTTENRLKLVATIQNLILSLENVVLTPSSVSVREYLGGDLNFVVFSLNL
mmetsp:Transcript_22423/g.21658  ORF Transcript_22423/g.21658 Transcript_22423/m.21658 type:complete len:95 (+) Transcript_22423:1212-1496(+)